MDRGIKLLFGAGAFSNQVESSDDPENASKQEYRAVGSGSALGDTGGG